MSIMNLYGHNLKDVLRAISKAAKRKSITEAVSLHDFIVKISNFKNILTLKFKRADGSPVPEDIHEAVYDKLKQFKNSTHCFSNDGLIYTFKPFGDNMPGGDL